MYNREEKLEEPEKLFEIFEDKLWDNNENIVIDITDKLIELRYSVSSNLEDPNIINVICEHGKVCRTILLSEDSDRDWTFDISDDDSIKDRCQICRKRKTIHYMFDGDALKFWDKETEEPNNIDFEEIDLNDFINWDEVNNKAIKEMKEKYPKKTIFVNIEE